MTTSKISKKTTPLKWMLVALGAFALALSINPPAAFADDVKWTAANGIRYEIDREDRTASVDRYRGTASTIAIASQVKYGGVWHKVISIDERAFYQSKLTKVTIPANIKEIDESAFQGSKQLKTLVIKGAREIEENAFKNCWKLSSVTLPATLQEIDDAAFKYAGKNVATTVKVPNNRVKNMVRECDNFKCTIKVTGSAAAAPKGTVITKMTGGQNTLLVKWETRTAPVKGYQVRIDDDRDMDDARYYTVAKNTASQVKFFNIDDDPDGEREKIWAQVRTYKAVDGKKVWSGWSAKKYQWVTC